MMDRRTFLSLVVRRVLIETGGLPAPYLRARIVREIWDAEWEQRAIDAMNLDGDTLLYNCDEALFQKLPPVTLTTFPRYPFLSEERQIDFGDCIFTAALADSMAFSSTQCLNRVCPIIDERREILKRNLNVSYVHHHEIFTFVITRIPRRWDLASHFVIQDPGQQLTGATLNVGTVQFEFKQDNKKWILQAFRPPYSPLPLVALCFVNIRVIVRLKDESNSAGVFSDQSLCCLEYHGYLLTETPRVKIAKQKRNMRMPPGHEHVSLDCGVLSQVPRG